MEIKLKIDASGFDKLTGPTTVNFIAGELYKEAEKIMTYSKNSFVPVVTGRLMGAGTVNPPEFTGFGVIVTMGYDRNVAPYAFIVHERDPNIGQGKNKYLERPFVERGEQAFRNIRDAWNANLNSILAGQTLPAGYWQQFRVGGQPDSAASEGPEDVAG